MLQTFLNRKRKQNSKDVNFVFQMRELLEDAKVETDTLRQKVWPERISYLTVLPLY